jgi:acyl-CoA synthetase (NDP forming)
VLKKVAARKPVVIWKGGRTEEGGRAIASHTGSLAVPQTIWEAVLRQCGAVKVTRMEELIDTLKALLYLPPVTGDRVAVAGGSGGQSVAIADVFAEAGLRVPELTQKSYDELASFFVLIGGGYRNPIDTGNVNSREMKRILGILERDDNIDNLVQLMTMRRGTPEQLQSNIDLLVDMKQRTSKTVMTILFWELSAQEVGQARGIIQKLQSGGVPVFPSMERGARALRNALDYNSHRASIDP